MTRKTLAEALAMSAKNRAAWPTHDTVARVTTFNNAMPLPPHKLKANTKYFSKVTEIDGIKFASKREAYRYLELKAEEKAGLITDLKLQVKFLLIPKQVRDDGVTERAVTYTADFSYVVVATGKTVIEDSKGMKTQQGIIRRKLMLWTNGISVKES